MNAMVDARRRQRSEIALQTDRQHTKTLCSDKVVAMRVEDNVREDLKRI